MSVRHQTQATGQPDLGPTRIGEQLRIPALQDLWGSWPAPYLAARGWYEIGSQSRYTWS